MRGFEMLPNCAPFDVSGHPAFTMPCGVSEGLPAGLSHRVAFTLKGVVPISLWSRRRRARQSPAVASPSAPSRSCARSLRVLARSVQVVQRSSPSRS
jgi:hypothetical protein